MKNDETVLSLDKVSKTFSSGDRSLEVLKQSSFYARAGESIAVVGPSGSGKTTLLRLAAGLEKLQTGRVTLSDGLAADHDTHVPPELREVGLMFQDFALFPHLSVYENLAFPLKVRKVDKSEIEEPHTLSVPFKTKYETKIFSAAC